MIINAVRFRSEGQVEWTTYKISPGTGRFRSVAAVTAAGGDAFTLAQAVRYVLTGQLAEADRQGSRLSGVLEASLQMSDDAGDTWIIHRQGDIVRYMRNGEAQPAVSSATAGNLDAATTFAHALLDMDGILNDSNHDGTVNIATTLIAVDKQGLYGKPFGQETTTRDQLRDVLGRQIADLAGEAGKALNDQEYGQPKTLARLARQLEPLHQEHKELVKQWLELNLDGKSDADQSVSVAKLREELVVAREIAQVASPLLEPGSSLKTLQETLAKIDSAIAEICAVCGLEQVPQPGEGQDFRKALEAVSRIEAFEKLIRATQAARKHCEQRVEPVFKNYLQAIESVLAGDRQIASELESCLATLDLKLRSRMQGGAEAINRKNWFERFKGPKGEVEPIKDDPLHELETGRMAIEYAVNRLNHLGHDLDAAKKSQESALFVIDNALEELTRNLSRLREHWATLAKQMNLAVNTSMNQLLKIIGYHSKLVQLAEQRQDLKDGIKQFIARHAQLERLVTNWRELTGSQKLTSLKTPGLLLTEARDVIRYLEARERKLQQLEETHEAQKALSALRGFMKARRHKLEAEWQKVFNELGLRPLVPDHPYLPELFKRANLVKALALAHGTVSKDGRQTLFKGAAKASVHLYLWDEASVDNQLKLQLVKGLEQSELMGITLVIAADPQIANLLQGLGTGVAQLIAKKPAAKVAAPPSKNIQKGGSKAASENEPRRPMNANLLEQRAKAALDLLTGQTKAVAKRL